MDIGNSNAQGDQDPALSPGLMGKFKQMLKAAPKDALGDIDLEKDMPRLEAAGREALAKLQTMSADELQNMLDESKKFRFVIPHFAQYVEAMEMMIAQKREEERARGGQR